GRWEVVVAAPRFVYGDMRPIALEAAACDACGLKEVHAYLSRWPHFMVYGRRLRQILHNSWDLVHCWEEPYVFPGFQVSWWTPRHIPFVFWTYQNLLKWYPPPFNWLERYCVHRCSG